MDRLLKKKYDIQKAQRTEFDQQMEVMKIQKRKLTRF